SEERSIFRLRSLAPPGDDEHVEVQQLSERWRVACKNDGLDEQELRVRCHCPVAVAQDREASVIVEALDDMSKQIRVTAIRDRLEEAARHRLAASGESSGLDALLRVRDDPGVSKTTPVVRG